MEKFSVNTRFCLICNYLSKIIPALQSRCTRFRFAPLKASQIVPRIQYIVKEERVNATDDGIKALIHLSEGDMRKVLNILQSTSAAFDLVNEHNVYLCCGHPLKEDIELILSSLLNQKFSKTYESMKYVFISNINWFLHKVVMDIKTKNGLALQDILTDLHPYVLRSNDSFNYKVIIKFQMFSSFQSNYRFI